MSKKLVWIENDIGIIGRVVRPLEKAGHNITYIYTPEEALKSIDIIRGSDLILLDMIIRPYGDTKEIGRYPGLSLLQEMREKYDINTPVVVLTVVNDKEIYKQLRELDVKDIIPKPVLPSELKRRVEQVLKDAENVK
jgi:CheY-like chemotaxis protein